MKHQYAPALVVCDLQYNWTLPAFDKHTFEAISSNEFQLLQRNNSIYCSFSLWIHTSSSSELHPVFLNVMFPHDCTAIIIATEWKQFWKMLWNFKVPIIIMCSQQFRKKTGPSAWHQLPSAPAPSLSALNTHRHTPINRKQILLCLQEGQGLWFLDLWDAIWGLKGHVKRTASWSTNKNSQRYLKSLAWADKIFEEGQHFASLFEVCLFAALQGVPHILEERRSVTWALAQSCSEPWLPPLSRITRYKKVLGLPSLSIKYSSCLLPFPGVSRENRRPGSVMVQALWKKSQHESSSPTTPRMTALLAMIGPILCFHTSQIPGK